MELGKPSPLSIILSVFLVGIIGYLIYVATTNVDTETSTYTKGASHEESSLTISPVENYYPLAFPRCGRTFDIDPTWFKKQEEKKAVKK